MDDQFAYIPNAFAATYFDGPPDPTDPDTKIAAAARAAASGDEGYVMVATHAKSCMWPEGALTCRVMRGGAKLELLAARMRIVKWCSGRDKMRCRPSWGNGGKCRGSPWGPKTDNGPKPPTVAATNWVMLKDGKLPRLGRARSAGRPWHAPGRDRAAAAPHALRAARAAARDRGARAVLRT